MHCAVAYGASGGTTAMILSLDKRIPMAKQALAVVLLLIGTGAISTSTSQRASNQTVFIRIAPEEWPQVQAVEWPGKARSVGVIFNVTSASKVCGKPLSGTAQSHLASDGIVFGVACGRLWVLMKSIPLEFSMQELDAIASHEAIHAITLSTTYKARLDVAGAHEESRPAKRHVANRFFNQLIETLSHRRSELTAGECSNVLAAYSSLSGPELAYVKDQIHTEWPAEFFMRTPDPFRDDSSYLQLRHKISRGNELESAYIAGGIAMVRIDHALGRSNWQRRLLSGESLVNMLFESLQCDSPPGEWHPLAVVKGQLPSLVR